MTKVVPFILAVVSSMFFAVGLPGYNVFFLSLVALVPLFFALHEKTLLQSFWIGFVFGFVVGLMYYGWVMQASAHYTGELTGRGILFYLVLSCYNALWYGAFGASYYFFVREKKLPLWRFVVGTASVWVTIEWLYQNAFSSFPWIIIFPYTQWSNLYLMQWLSVGGMWLVSLFVVCCNVMLFLAVRKRKYKLGGIALAVFLFVHIAGYFMYNSVEGEEHPSMKAVLLQENIKAEARWDDAFVDSLAHILLDLNRQAAAVNPQLIVWSETAIPWTFQTDDDLVNEALKITYLSGASHLIGMLTEADKRGNVFNSLYYIEPDGKVSARYDKRELLAFLEKPIVSWQLPFQQSRYENIVEGTRTNIIATRYGILGALICNETLSSYHAARAVREGAQALVAASNDSWFYGSVLTDAHRALTRMRAIETRKDIVFNANRGYCGVLRASGRMETMSPSEIPRYSAVNVRLNNQRTVAAQYPDTVAYLALAVVFLHIIQLLKRKS